MVEKGRHTSPITPLEKRLCKHCNLNKIEDEYHFIMECSLYNRHRTKLFSDLRDMLCMDSMSEDDIFTFIMCAEDYDILNLIIPFVNTCFDTRELG
jgi:hypothetical protein